MSHCNFSLIEYTKRYVCVVCDYRTKLDLDKPPIRKCSGIMSPRPPMQWAYGVTTVPERFGTTLVKTLASLKDAGFDKPRLFVDGGVYIPKQLQADYEITHHMPKLNAYGNWVTAAWELFIRNPNAERFAIFQDDFITYPNLRDYLSRSPYPDKGYLNLYTFPENVSENKDNVNGWYLSNQYGRGAVALVFNRDALTTLLAQPHFVNRPMSARRGWKCIDGGIVQAMKNAGYKEYVHSPSLVQHIGDVSTLGNPQHAKADTFLGPEFDARELLKITPSKVTLANKLRKRIGLVGFNCNSGLGVLNDQLATHIEIDQWMVKPHNHYPTLPDHPDVDTIHCPQGKKLQRLMQYVDTVVFCETPLYHNMVDFCKQNNKRVVCIPMLEWLPLKGWPEHVDLFICPTPTCYDEVSKQWPDKSVYFPWPIDTDKFKYKERTSINQFVFINGHGGWHGRKGASCIRKAKELWPEMPLVVYSQVQESWPEGTKVLPPPKTNDCLYTTGDVLLFPHCVDGLGLEALEAIASGMGVIATRGRHWDWFPTIAHIQSNRTTVNMGRPIDWYEADPEDLVSICKSQLAKPHTQHSQFNRSWALAHSWNSLKDKLTNLIRYGVPDDTI